MRFNKNNLFGIFQGIIAANSKIDIGITFNPNEVCDLNLQLECIARERGLKGVF
jgi:hypothetical protein